MPTSFRSRRCTIPVLPLLAALGFGGFATPAPAQNARAQNAASTILVRPPAVPLVAHDPYFSVWSTTDALNAGPTRHWTGSEQPLTSLVRVDGKAFALMGAPGPGIAPMPQKGLAVLPTRTVYTFANAAVEVRLSFVSPLLPDDLDVLSRPATYVVWNVRSLDGKPHDASVYLDASGLLAVNDATQRVNGRLSEGPRGGLTTLSLASEAQDVLGRSGDDLRIEWGRLLLAAPASESEGNLNLAGANAAEFAATGRPARRGSPLLFPERADRVAAALTLPLGRVGARPVSRHAILAYDDEFSIQYFGRSLRPYWRRKGADADALLAMAERDYPALMARCERFDAELMADLTKAGGPGYAAIAALAYRQSLAAQKLVADPNDRPLSFAKENDSNGCVATVDVLYPAAPQLLFLSPSLAKAALVPILDYAASPRWRWPFAPHDLGQYPLANGQVYGGGERTEKDQMPVEETGNMLLLLAALARIEGNADLSARYWPTLSRWAAYLAEKGFDPESQLSTDDFAGYLAHNVNLSAKAIEALGAYAALADRLGKREESAKYRRVAEDFARRWSEEVAKSFATPLAFDKPGTWSQKYNLVWDRLLGLNLFPASLAVRETAFYRTRLNPYGLPLDSRRDYTKLDWTVWTATLSGNKEDFEALVNPSLRFLNETPDRVPMSDWHETKTPRRAGFKARSVVGGVFIKMLDDPAVWRKWARRDRLSATLAPDGWAPFPKPPVVTPVAPTSEASGRPWSYTTDRPAEGWAAPAFDASAWKRGVAGFGHGPTAAGTTRTPWNTPDLWLRRDFDLPAGTPLEEIQLEIQHDDDAEVYVNGALVARLPGANNRYETRRLLKATRGALRPGRNTLAIHCRDTGGEAYIDAGLVTVRYPK